MDKFEEVKEYSKHILGNRSIREQQWRNLSDWLCPHRGIFDSRDLAPNGERRNRDAFTATAQYALSRGASGITSGMTPRNISWFEPDFNEASLIEESGARAYLDAIDTKMKVTLEVGGFYQAIHAFNTDLLWAGCALLYSEKSEIAPLRFECIQVGTFAVQLNPEGGLDAVLRTMAWTPAQIARLFGTSSMSTVTKEKLKTRPYDLIRVSHLVRYREYRNPEKIDNKNMPYESFFWEEGGEDFLHVGGYNEMPYFFTCWHEGTTPYGTGVGDDALMDSRQIDALEHDKLRGIGKLVAPPMQADVNLKGTVRLGRGELNFVDGDKTITPILDLRSFAQALQYIQEELQTVGQRLEQELMASVFASVPFDQRPRDMSATEFLERKREALQQLGPIMSAYEPRVLTPLLHRVLNVLDREGHLPIPPQSLWGFPISVKMDFISPMANALRQTGAEATRALVNEVLAMAQVDPNVLDKIDLDQCVDELAYGLGASGKVVRADADVEQIRQARAQQQAMMQQQQAALAQAQTGATAAGGLADLAGAAQTVNNLSNGE